MDLIAAFPRRSEFEKARSVLARLKLPHRVVPPDPGYSLVGAPALRCDPHGLCAAQPAQCTPVFTDQYAALRAALLEICRGLGVPNEVSGGL
jgi:hypothetical protein